MNPILLRAALLTVAAASPVLAQSRFELLRDQTPLKRQGNRNTCVTFAAVAALEAAYKRAGYGNVDLSEEFENYAGKLFWLHPRWNEVTSAAKTENQVAAFGGGGGVGHVWWLCNGMRIPDEQRMPYRQTGYDLGAHPSWTDPHWQVQRNVDDFNLDRRNLPRAALTAPRYFRGTGYTDLANPRSTSQIEAALRARKEVVWDFLVNGDRTGAIWHADPSRPAGGAHSMLIVGYDRSHPDPRQHHFICKNSWGPTSNPGGYTHIGYDYVQYGYEAAYFDGVATPAPWPQLAFVGRWNICFDGWRGTLDVNHLPGIAQLWLDRYGAQAVDRRVGMFFDTSGNAFRVNGRIVGNELQFWWKGGFANMRWDDQRESTTGVGSGFRYHLVDDAGVEMAGWHQNNPGLLPNPAYGGYARQPSTILGSDGFLRPVFSGSTPVDALQYLGSWDVKVAGVAARVVFERRDDSIVPAARRGTWAGLRARILEGGSSRPATAMVLLSSPRTLDLSFSLADGRAVTTDCWMLTWQRGVFAGAATVGGVTEAILAVRVADAVLGGFTRFGTACGGALGNLRQNATGTPSVGGSIVYQLTNARANTRGVLNLGLSDRFASGGLRLPFSLTAVGAPGCWYLTEPAVSVPVVADGGGRASVPFVFQGPSMIGLDVFTQFVVFDATANALGLTFSDGIRTRLGG